jgi:DNA polymerase-3 subunit chi
MTQIDFYTHVEDPIRTACRLAAKAFEREHRVLVSCADADTASRIDRMLWTTPAIAFVPHCYVSDPLARVTPVVIDYLGAEPPHDEVLINLRPERPTLFARFQRLIEIVTSEEEDRRAARERFKFYRDRGYELKTHDLSNGA